MLGLVLCTKLGSIIYDLAYIRQWKCTHHDYYEDNRLITLDDRQSSTSCRWIGLEWIDSLVGILEGEVFIYTFVLHILMISGSDNDYVLTKTTWSVIDPEWEMTKSRNWYPGEYSKGVHVF